MKKCTRCKRIKLISKFYKNAYWCKKCFSNYYKENRQHRINMSNSYIKRNLDFVKKIKNNSLCTKCGFDNPIALDFHHRDPNQKSFELSGSSVGGRSLETIQEELDKCDILCANCHRILHNDRM